MVLRDAVSTLDNYVYMVLDSCFKVHKQVSVNPKNIKLRQIITLNVIFHVVGQTIDLVKP